MADDVASLLNEVGNLLALDTVYPLEGTFLYVEAAPQMVSASVFKDLGDHLLYRWLIPGLDAVLLELWEAEPPKKRWTAMQYMVNGGQFTASFSFDKIDPKESSIKRRQAILDQRYGNKQVVYPPLQ